MILFGVAPLGASFMYSPGLAPGIFF